MKKYILTTATLLAMFAAGCAAPKAEPKEAVRKALLQYLAARQNLSMDKMDIDVSKVNVTGDTADAEVSFKVKGTNQGMSMRYTLHRAGDTWTVDKGSSTAPNHPSPGASESMAAPPPTGGMPAGHPPVAQEKPSLPAKKK
jgi:hypothetical protein